MSVEMVMNKVVATCRPRDTLLDAVRVMLQEDVGSVVVVSGDGSGRVVGLLTQRDLCAAAARTEKALGQLEVRCALTGEVHLCQPDDPLMDALQSMCSARVRRLPVVDQKGHLMGIIGLGDIARAAAEDQAGLPVLSSRSVCRTMAECAQRRTETECLCSTG